jgi:ferrous iron transport protein A
MTDSSRDQISLASLPSGCTFEVVGFLGCRKRAQRLVELGMTPGTHLEIVRSMPGQPLLLRVRGALLAVDRCSAGDIIVRPLEVLPLTARSRRSGYRPRWHFRLKRGRRSSRRRHDR